jgi:hypothetical protein
MNRQGVDRSTITMIVLIAIITMMFLLVWLKLRGTLGGLGP